ncbi:ANKRD50 [Symbiodinium sp. CCMP2592]|nr:ANKRD50 [Symbiodinium sp. CCMP2592]CAE7324194.1 ANKRD50 [Symbiodinium sp. CCMP2592]
MDGIFPAAKQAPLRRPGKFARRTRRKASGPQQLRICKLSGEVVAKTNTHRHRTPMDLLTYLEPVCGVSKYRIRLLHDGQRLRKNGVRRFSSAEDLQVVLLPYVRTNSNSQVSRNLREALYEQDTAKLKKLLWRPVDPNTTFPRYLPRPITALEFALLNQGPRTKTVLLTLLEAKAALDRPENQGMLCTALKHGEDECVRLLLKHRADPNGSKNRIMPIDIACQRRPEQGSFQREAPKTVAMLLSAKADVQPMLRDANSWAMQPTPRDYLDYIHPRTLASTVSLVRAAVMHANPTFMQQLVQTAENANVCILPACLCSAAYGGNEHAVLWLLNAQAAVDSHICHLVLKGAHQLLFSVHARRTALALAAGRGHCGIVAMLLRARADPNTRLDGQTALLQAAAHGAPETVVCSILKAAGEVNREDSFGRTALRLALLYRKPPDLQVVQALLQAKADKQHKDQFGRSPLSIAAQKLDGALLNLMQDDAMQK